MLVLGEFSKDDFCQRLADALKPLPKEPVDFFPIEQTDFTDGEFKLRLTDGYDGGSRIYEEPDELIKRLRGGEKAVFVARGEAGELWKPDRLFVKTLFALGTLRTFGAHQEDICAVLPYYMFSRQHEIYRSGESPSAKTVRKAIKDQLAGVVITVSAHNYRHEGEMDNRVWNMDATESVIGYARGLETGSQRYVVTPDSGQYSGRLRFPLANALNAGTIAFGKERDRASGEIDVDVRNLDGLKNPEDVDIFLYDDELSTGETMRKDIERCTARGIGPDKIHVLVVHNKDAYNTGHRKRATEVITETGADLAASDTVYSGFSRFSIVPQLAGYIHKRFW